MTEFKRSEWNKSENVHNFVENSDNYIVERKLQFQILRSFFQFFLKNKIKNRTIRVLDLGSGDGRISSELLRLNTNIEIFLVDGSLEMLEKARLRLNGHDHLHFINETFQDLIASDILVADFDFIVSSLAIHHLSADEKEEMFGYLYNHLNDGGYFFNMDVVLPSTGILDEWYMVLWQEWIQENERKLGHEENFQHIPSQFKNNPDNHPETLENQLYKLKKIGFKNVDCHFKYGIFSIYSGER
ncbi:MAG: methyltransferase [Methanobacterium sp.]